MRKFILAGIALGLALICGCSRAEIAWECVTDEADTPVFFAQDAAYTMHFDVPEDAVETVGEDGGTVFMQQDGGYTIRGRTLYAAGVESAVHMVTGQAADDLCVIETEKYDLPMYHFTWYEQETGMLCRAAMIVDGQRCYVLSVAQPEGLGTDYDSTVGQVFASWSLDMNEGF